MSANRLAATVDFRRDDLVLGLGLPDTAVVALTGPNGAGKTTLLRCLAGLEPAAEVRWTDAAPARLGYLPQRIALYPTMSLADNISSSLRFAHIDRVTAAERTKELLELFDITPLGGRRPHEVSGGQRQRAGLARAIAARPDLVLLDEPFAAVDIATRGQVRRRVFEYLEATGARCVLATHDPDDISSTGASSVLVG